MFPARKGTNLALDVVDRPWQLRLSNFIIAIQMIALPILFVPNSELVARMVIAFGPSMSNNNTSGRTIL